jgi:protein-L-isoaspartate(D-aspartate) O-methyltransferase
MSDFDRLRARMVRDHLAARGIRSGHVLSAMRLVPREAFVASELAEFAYDDAPLPIAAGQTISQPFIVAMMLDAVRVLPGERVLEIGAGSGYAAAVMSRIAGEVFAVERHAELVDAARERLAELGYDNVQLLHADGTLGWPEHAPYDAIIVSAGGPAAPKALLEQLAIGGRLVIPVGRTSREQRLLRVTRTTVDEYVEDDLGGVRFVPLIGQQGWHENVESPIRTSATGGSALAGVTGHHSASHLSRPIARVVKRPLEDLAAKSAGKSGHAHARNGTRDLEIKVGTPQRAFVQQRERTLNASPGSPDEPLIELHLPAHVDGHVNQAVDSISDEELLMPDLLLRVPLSRIEGRAATSSGCSVPRGGGSRGAGVHVAASHVAPCQPHPCSVCWVSAGNTQRLRRPQPSAQCLRGPRWPRRSHPRCPESSCRDEGGTQIALAGLEPTHDPHERPRDRRASVRLSRIHRAAKRNRRDTAAALLGQLLVQYEPQSKARPGCANRVAA